MDVSKLRFRACVIGEKTRDVVLLVLPAVIAFSACIDVSTGVYDC